MRTSERAPVPTWRPEGQDGLRLDPGPVGMVLSLTTLMVLMFVLKVPRGVVIALALVFPVGTLAWSMWMTRAWRRFEREINAALMSRDPDRPLRVYRQARLLRWFGPRHRMLTKFGAVLSLRGRHVAARAALEEAYVRSPARERAALLAPIAHELYALEAWDELAKVAEQWRVRTAFKAPADVYVAVALAHLGDSGDRARSLLDGTEGALAADLLPVAERARARLAQPG